MKGRNESTLSPSPIARRRLLFVGDSTTRNLLHQLVTFFRSWPQTLHYGLTPEEVIQITDSPMDAAGAAVLIDHVSFEFEQTWGWVDGRSINESCAGTSLDAHIDRMQTNVQHGMNPVAQLLPRVRRRQAPDVLILGVASAHEANTDRPINWRRAAEVMGAVYLDLASRGFRGRVIVRGAAAEAFVPWRVSDPQRQWCGWHHSADLQRTLGETYGWSFMRTLDMAATRPDRFYDHLHIRAERKYPRKAADFPATQSAAIMRRFIHTILSLPLQAS